MVVLQNQNFGEWVFYGYDSQLYCMLSFTFWRSKNQHHTSIIKRPPGQTMLVLWKMGSCCRVYWCHRFVLFRSISVHGWPLKSPVSDDVGCVCKSLCSRASRCPCFLAFICRGTLHACVEAQRSRSSPWLGFPTLPPFSLSLSLYLCI